VTQAEIEGNIGNFALFRGRYDEALDYLERSRRRYAELGMAHQSAIAEQEIADAYMELNLVPEAEEIYERVIPKFDELRMRAEQARALMSHGRALIARQRVDEAQTALALAGRLFAAEGNKVGEATVRLVQAQLDYNQSDYEVASKRAAEAMEVLSNSGSWQRRLLARWLQGDAERAQGHTEIARSILTESLHDSETYSQPQVAERCCTSLGLLAQSSGDARSAEKYFQQAIGLIEEFRAPLPGEEFRAAFFSNKLVPYHEMVRLCLSGDKDRSADALVFAESAKSRALADALRFNDKTQQPRDEFESSLLRDVETLREELNYLYNQLNQPYFNEGERDAAAIGKLHEELREREHKILTLERQFQHRHEKFSGKHESFDLSRLQKQLGLDKALVEYTTLDEELIAFVVTDQQVKVIRNLGSEAEIANRIAHFRFQIDTLRYGSEMMRQRLPALEVRTRKHLQWLYDKLIRPLEPIIEGRNLVVVPHRGLHYLPFHALNDGVSYAIEKREFSYAPSGFILQQCLDRAPINLSAALLLGVAGDQMAGVRDEIKAIKEQFPNATAFLDDSATLRALRENVSAADVVHLACHAHFRSDNPLFSALHLVDGWLTVRDASSLELHNTLVTLSACETGVSSVAPGDELIGLARGFFAAGAPSILLTLWTVDDESTSELMKDFYRELLRTGSPSQSLRAVQMKMLIERPHPFFWSPFVLVGRW
jgi:CHAT domain-containing protein